MEATNQGLPSLYDQARTAEASSDLPRTEHLYNQIIAIREQSEGREAAIRDKHNLVDILLRQDKHEEAEQMATEVLTFLEGREEGRETGNFREQERSTRLLLKRAMLGQGKIVDEM
ncbi:hypothetical protein BDZ85DRAFT_249378 [Elsinoe ampelina]|uniref:Uncharacterized protein n=1 Tax=Elsinoe ampelina TaxID=302913 RepID=A0A6A6GCL5_9PEZI|nr:hypothetical protein BDZ85DRAFT_249378 [Elsinoe ampelina]